MNDPTHAQDWTDANQQLLVAEFASLRAKLGDGTDPGEAEAQLRAAQAAMPAPSAIDRIVEAFDLSSFERELLLLCAGVEMDSKLAAACANGGREGRSAATFGLALATLDAPHWSAVTPMRPLRRWRLIEVEPGRPLTEAPLRIDERILHYLAGINLLDARLQPLLETRAAPILMAAEQQRLAETVATAWSEQPLPWAPIHLTGDDASGAEDVAAAAAASVSLQLLVLRAEDLPTGAAEIDRFITLWQREAVLLPAALLVQCGDTVPDAALAALVERLHAPLMIGARVPLRLRHAIRSHDVRKPEAAEQKRLWQQALGATGAKLNGALDGIAAQYRLSAQAIATAANLVQELIGAGESAPQALSNTCRTTARCRLDELAQHIPRGAGWDDLVLPEPQLSALHQIAAQVRNRLRVYDEWAYGRRCTRGLGVAALFSGESGTGKTLAAEVLASELNLALYRIDLSSVVSKYIGETEKNLRRVFDAAEDSGAILLFDEADALFGKRSEVKDSHDRYANIEVSYLLQRMEAYRGLAILTTNLKSALDPSFQRRLRFIVHFPFPDAERREAIWRRSIPDAAPRSDLDFRKLAQLHVPGGAIRNIALNAAFLAADANGPVTMTHLLAAATAESAKLARPLSATETRGWQ